MSTAPAANLDFLAQLFSGRLPESAQEMRAVLERFGGLINSGAPEVGAIHEKVLVREVEGGPVTADVCVPRGAGPHPVLVYLHGGGWICGSPATHRKLGLRFAEAGYLVFNIDYRLAPEAPFPAPLDDCIDAIRWAARSAERFDGDASRLAVGGDSAGGNLSAAAAAALADDPEAPRISAALLIYGVFDFARLRPDDLRLEEGPLAFLAQGVDAAELGPKLVDLMVHSYLGATPSAGLLADPRVSPIHAAAKLPPCHVVVGDADPLVAQSQALTDELARHGVAHEHVVVPGMPHGFAQMEFFAAARESVGRMVSFLEKHLGR